jgi:hypothetical protein
MAVIRMATVSLLRSLMADNLVSFDTTERLVPPGVMVVGNEPQGTRW